MLSFAETILYTFFLLGLAIALMVYPDRHQNTVYNHFTENINDWRVSNNKYIFKRVFILDFDFNQIDRSTIRIKQLMGTVNWYIFTKWLKKNKHQFKFVIK